MTITTVTDVASLLAPWHLSAARCDEIPHRGRASRTWCVAAAQGRFVAKLAFDRRRYVEPGLRVARAVAAASGVATGPPVPTGDGDLCVEVRRSPSRPWTLALLTPVPGEPLEPSHPAAESVAGDLLGRVHASLARASCRTWVPADLLEWAASFAAATGNARAAALVAEIAARRADLRFSVVYGDPSPEILVDSEGSVGLIDWGTPSWGPQLHDVAVWLRWLGERPGAGTGRERRFLAAYRRHVPLSSAEVQLLDLFGRYAAALFRSGPAGS